MSCLRGGVCAMAWAVVASVAAAWLLGSLLSQGPVVNEASPRVEGVLVAIPTADGPSLSELLRAGRVGLERHAATAVRTIFEPAVEGCLADRPAQGQRLCELESVLRMSSPPDELWWLKVGARSGQVGLRLSVLSLAEASAQLSKAHAEAGELTTRREQARVYRAATQRILEARLESPLLSLDDGPLEVLVQTALGAPPLSQHVLPRVQRDRTRVEVRVEPAAELKRLEGPSQEIGLRRLGEQAQWRVVGLLPGLYSFSASKKGFYEERIEMLVELGKTSSIALALDRDHRGSWDAMTYSGAAVLATGLAVGVWGFVEADARPLRSSDGSGFGIRLLGPESSTLPTSSPRSDGPLVASLASGLAVTGGSMLVWGLANERPTRPPWWALAVSVLGGVAVAGALEIADAL